MTEPAIEIVPCLRDNYAYLVRDHESDLCAVVDPSEPGPVIERLKIKGWHLTHILNTHHHFDHTGGNVALKEMFAAEVVGPGKDHDRIPAIDTGVDETSNWRFGAVQVRILEIPAHTRAHIAFVLDGAAFTGDTLFAMGCGRLFEGTPELMCASLAKLVRLPDSTRIYCGHEYTLNNGRFAQTIEPGNQDLARRQREVEAARAKSLPTIPSTIEMEKRTNPFLRTSSSEIRKTLGLESASDTEVFAELRRRKDTF